MHFETFFLTVRSWPEERKQPFCGVERTWEIRHNLDGNRSENLGFLAKLFHKKFTNKHGADAMQLTWTIPGIWKEI